jgi:hypothetical protein
MNEDSFFNDDNDVDQADDKINALVTNIINSSELIDSENEKTDNIKKANPTSSCSICNKTFKNDKVLEKHMKTSTHILKEKRKRKLSIESKGPTNDIKLIINASNDETKIFRTKGALKTFENIRSASPVKHDSEHLPDEFKPIVEDSTSFIPLKETENFEDDDEELSTKDRIFDSLFSNIENKLQAAAKNELLPKYDFPTLSHHDSESSSTSWDLKHDADIDWDSAAAYHNESNCKNSFSSVNNKVLGGDVTSAKTNITKFKSKTKEPIVPTKSLIMGKIFKKHCDKQKSLTPQADAPNNKPDIKNSLDEIFDHLKNSAEIDDKVLTCPSPKTLLKNSGRTATFSSNPSHTNDMLETASHSNNVNIKHVSRLNEKNSEKKVEPEQIGIGKRKSRRRCAINMKTFAETWSSDEYEELHDTNDIISIINEIEKRESNIKKRDADAAEHTTSSVKISECNLKKTSTLGNKIQNLKKRRLNSFKDGGHKSDDDLKNMPKNSQMSLKKRRMSCFVPSTTNFNAQNFHRKANVVSKACINESSKMMALKNCRDLKQPDNKVNIRVVDIKVSSISKNNSDHTKGGNNNISFRSSPQSILNIKKKNLKHRKKPRNKVKNIAYDSDSDFELNLGKKLKTTASSTAYSESDNDSEQEKEPIKDVSYRNKNELMNMLIEQSKHSLPNDLNEEVYKLEVTSTPEAAILQSEKHDSEDLSPFKTMHDNSCNRTKRHSSEKLYYWSSSSSSDSEQGDMPEGGGNEHSTMIPQQKEQHGWIVGDSHKKLVTLLAHAKIKNKIN